MQVLSARTLHGPLPIAFESAIGLQFDISFLSPFLKISRVLDRDLKVGKITGKIGKISGKIGNFSKP